MIRWGCRSRGWGRRAAKAAAAGAFALSGACGSSPGVVDTTVVESGGPPALDADAGALAPACAPEAAHAITGSLPLWNLGVAIDGDDVYYRTFDPHTVWRMPIAGGPARRVWTGEVGIFGAGIGVAGGFAYWSGLVDEESATGAIYRAPVSGGAALVVGYLPSRCAAYGGLAVDESYVYAGQIACSIGVAALSRFPVGGGGGKTLWSDDDWTIGGMALTSDAVALSVSSNDGDHDLDDESASGQVLLVPKRGGPARVLAHTAAAAPIAADDDHVYFVDGDALRAIAIGGGAVQLLATGVRYATSIAVGDGRVLVGVGGTRSRKLHVGRVVAVDTASGAITAVASGIDQLGNVSVVGGAVYYATLGSPSDDSGGAVFRANLCR